MIRSRSHLTLADFILVRISLVQIAMPSKVSHALKRPGFSGGGFI
jgi:hypothetical protein